MLRVDGRLQGGGNDVEIGRWTTDKASGERAQVGVVGEEEPSPTKPAYSRMQACTKKECNRRIEGK